MRRVQRVAERTGNYNLATLFDSALSDPDVVAEATEYCAGRCSARGDGETFFDRLLAWITSPEFIDFLMMIIGLFSGSAQADTLKKEAEAARLHLGIAA
jgi:hypothetical protein